MADGQHAGRDGEDQYRESTGTIRFVRQGDFEAIRDITDPDIELHEPKGIAGGGTHHGFDEIVENVVSRIGDEWEDVSVVPERYLADGDTVVVLHTWSGTSSKTGKSVEYPNAHVFDFEDGKVVQWRLTLHCSTPRAKTSTYDTQQRLNPDQYANYSRHVLYISSAACKIHSVPRSRIVPDLGRRYRTDGYPFRGGPSLGRPTDLCLLGIIAYRMFVTSTHPTDPTHENATATDSVLVTPVANEGTLELANGRLLGYAEYGPADGTPLVFCHGSPGSRYQRHPDASLLETHGVRQITIERPGYGNSTYQPGRTLLDWPNDVAEAADILDVPEFFLVGLSGGGPHALACAARIPERLLGVAILDSPGPVADPEAAAVLPAGLRLAVRIIPLRGVSRLIGYIQARTIRKDPEAFMESLGERWGKVDLEVFRRPAVREMFREDFTEAVRPGSTGLSRDLRIALRDWGFELAQIETHVDVWHGELDGSAPVELARYVVAELPDATAHYRADAGHLLIFEYWDEILSTLVTRVERSDAGGSNG